MKNMAKVVLRKGCCWGRVSVGYGKIRFGEGGRWCVVIWDGKDLKLAWSVSWQRGRIYGKLIWCAEAVKEQAKDGVGRFNQEEVGVIQWDVWNSSCSRGTIGVVWQLSLFDSIGQREGGYGKQAEVGYMDFEDALEKCSMWRIR